MLLQISFTWPIVIIFIVIILFTACIVCVVIQDKRSSRARSYGRTSSRDPWLPEQEISPKEPSWEPSQYQIDVLVCSCGKWNDKEQTSCWNCHASLANVNPQTFSFETAERCAVCGFFVYPGEQIVLCPACHAQGHRAHMLEFFKAKGCCPVCSQKLGQTQVLNTIPIIRKATTESFTE